MTLQFTTTVTIVGDQTITGYDSGNRPIYDTPETPSPGWVLWPHSSSEDTTQEDITTDVLEGLAPNDVDLTSISQVKVPGFDKAFEVQATPWPWKSPFTGTAPGVQVILKKVS